MILRKNTRKCDVEDSQLTEKVKRWQEVRVLDIHSIQFYKVDFAEAKFLTLINSGAIRVVHKNLIAFARLSKAILISFLLVLFLVAPSLDNIACDQCSSPFQGKWSDSPHLCSLCFHTFAAVMCQSLNIPLTSFAIGIERTTVPFSGLVLSINKPPQN